MTPQFDNQVVSSFILWLDHIILEKGQAYTNFGSNFYKVRDSLNGYYTYGLPFKQIVSDSSIAGANILSGVYINGTFIPTGGDLVDINYEGGQVYFGSAKTTEVISGNYSVKDFNIHLLDRPEYELLFETKFHTRPRTTRQVTGLASEVITYPSIFVENIGGNNEPFAFGGMDKTSITMRCVVIADTKFKLDAVKSLLRDRDKTYIPYIPYNMMPFNALGGLTSGIYNFNNLSSSLLDDTLFLKRINISRGIQNTVIETDVKNLNPNAYATLIDFELESLRYPRL